MYRVNNLPARCKSYIVARECDDREFWFWGTYDTFDEAADAAWDIGGQIFEKECVDNA